MKKLLFAHQLRAFAVFVVMISHLVGAYWGMPNVIAQATFSHVQQSPIPIFTSFAFNDYVHLGPLGVAIFFLISGFVIPMTITKVGPSAFLIGRSFRIYPTYILSSLFSLLVLYLSAYYWGNDFSKNFIDVVLNFFLVHNYFGVPSIDLVNWTLAIEIKFYLLMALFAKSIVKHKTAPVFAIIIGVSAFNLYSNEILLWLDKEVLANIFKQLMLELTYISYMLIGVFFYFHYVGKLTTHRLITYLFTAFGLFSITWLYGVVEDAYAIVVVDYFYGAVIFSGAYFMQGLFKENRVIDRIGDISYPLYIIHSLVGYSLLSILIDLQLTYLTSLVVTFVIIFLMAYLIHLLIEVPSNRLGKKVAISWSKRERLLPIGNNHRA